MSKANLHSILNRPWYIEQSYGESHLPLVFNMLSGNSIATKVKEEVILSLQTKAGLYTSEGEEESDKNSRVAVISIKNPITKYSQWCGPAGTKSMMNQMDRLKTDDAVAGVVLDIDSGGGQVYGTPEFYDYLKDFPKPVVSYTDGLMCSAAYYIGSAASHIVANKRAEAIGSIGAYAQFLDVAGYYEKLGAKVHTIYATKSTEKNKAYREALDGKYESYIKTELDPIVETFHADMKASRSNLSEEVFKGATWSGPDALEKGLVDELGTIKTAIDKVFELAETNNTKTNINTQHTTMDKSFPKLETALNMEAGFESTDAGVFLNEEQLETVENHITQLEAAANNELDLRTAAETRATNLETAATAAATANTTIVGEVNASLGLEGDEAVTDVAGAFAALNSHIAVLGKQPGDTHTKTKKKEDEDSKFAYLDFDSPLYQPNK